MSDVVILGGPNGAGKTTAAQSLLPSEIEVAEFVNADEIARELSPQQSEVAAIAAGRIMLQRMEELRRLGNSFAFETTCSGRGHARFLQRCKDDGWRIVLLFLWLPSIEAALERVARRVSLGGHSIPPDVIARRYAAGIANMREIYLPLSDIAAIYDNSDNGRTLIAERLAGEPMIVHNPSCWAQIEEVSL
jgi:predicted ABC-type ATPase